MSRQRRGPVTNSLGIVIPADIAEIADDFERRPQAGRLLDRINAHSRQVSKRAVAAKKKHHVENNRGLISSENFSFELCTPAVTPKFRGLVGLPSSKKIAAVHSVIRCSGYLVSMCPGDASEALVVLETPDMGKIPCLCPSSLLDKTTIAAGKAFSMRQAKKRKAMSCENAENIRISSTPAHSGDTNGHLIIDGARGIKGRVVDSKMLDSLNSGCLRVGVKSRFSFYTLECCFAIQKFRLKESARLVVASSQGMKLCPIGRSELRTMVKLGQMAIDSNLEYHRTLISALTRLDEARNLPAPTVDDLLLQASIGGEPDSMFVGKFLPCQGRRSCPDIKTRCDCGFSVDDTMKAEAASLLKQA